MLQILKVSGDSLFPTFRDGDFVVITKIPIILNSLRPGNIVVFRHPVYGILIKRVEWIGPGNVELFVVGDHPDSIDSRQFGPIDRNTLIGKVIWHIPKV